MPKLMKNRAIELLDGGLESYLLALYGLTLPNMRVHKHQESKYAPIMGLFGASTELIIKACLVQEKILMPCIRTMIRKVAFISLLHRKLK